MLSLLLTIYFNRIDRNHAASKSFLLTSKSFELARTITSSLRMPLGLVSAAVHLIINPIKSHKHLSQDNL
jgi:hypothetical protein